LLDIVKLGARLEETVVLNEVGYALPLVIRKRMSLHTVHFVLSNVRRNYVRSEIRVTVRFTLRQHFVDEINASLNLGCRVRPTDVSFVFLLIIFIVIFDVLVWVRIGAKLLQFPGLLGQVTRLLLGQVTRLLLGNKDFGLGLFTAHVVERRYI